MRRQAIDLRVRQALRLQLGAGFVVGLAAHQRFGLREAVRDQQAMMIAELIVGLDADEKVGRDQPRALVQQLVERVLAVRAGLAPDDRRRSARRRHGPRDRRACRCFPSRAAAGKRAGAAGAVRTAAPRASPAPSTLAYQTPSRPRTIGHVALERRGAEVLVHLVRAVEKLLEVSVAGGQRDRQADRRPQRVAAADPVPEHEHVLRRDAEGLHFGLVGRDRDEVLGDGGLVLRAMPGTTRARIARWPSSPAW